MFSATLYCTDAEDCGATYEVFSMDPDHGITDCRFCGSELFDVGTPTVSAEPDGLMVQEVEVTVTWGPWQSPWPRTPPPEPFEAKPWSRIDVLAHLGEPVVSRLGRDLRALIGLDDLTRLSESAGIEVCARAHPPGEDWSCDVPALGAFHRGVGLDAALCGLTVAVRRRLRKLLAGDSPERRELLPLLLRLWVADQQGRLVDLLRESVARELDREIR